MNAHGFNISPSPRINNSAIMAGFEHASLAEASTPCSVAYTPQGNELGVMVLIFGACDSSGLFT